MLAGLRRKEIDLLEWDSFLWESGVIRVQATRYFDAKTEDSLGDVAVDTELLELFRGYRARATGSFVIDGQPRSGVNYYYYRCQEVFERLSAWLRQNGVNTIDPCTLFAKNSGASCAQPMVSMRPAVSYATPISPSPICSTPTPANAP